MQWNHWRQYGNAIGALETTSPADGLEGDIGTNARALQAGAVCQHMLHRARLLPVARKRRPVLRHPVMQTHRPAVDELVERDGGDSFGDAEAVEERRVLHRTRVGVAQRPRAHLGDNFPLVVHGHLRMHPTSVSPGD